MIVERSITGMRAALANCKRPVGLVPTMGSLHAGHASLLDAARESCGTVVMSLFVNPSQFGEATDLERYPRDETQDVKVAEGAGVDLVFAPAADEMYPAGFDTRVQVGQLGSILEGAHRPDHFRGVATVCLKLFHIVRPDIAFFGQKDAQQVAVLRRMLDDFDLPLELRALATVREADGLALSSRNARLSPEERLLAAVLPRALATGDPDKALAALRNSGVDVDYVEIAPFDPPVLVGAIRIGSTRLIDNLPLKETP